jgi:cell division transport system permease protein
MNEINRKQLKPEAAQPKRPPMRIRPMAPILPPSNIQGNALMVVIAIMAFLACLTLGAVSMVRATAATWQSQISREITIQIKPEDGMAPSSTMRRHRAFWSLGSAAVSIFPNCRCRVSSSSPSTKTIHPISRRCGIC